MRGSKVNCGNCQFFISGTCRQSAPRMAGWPAVRETDWCGSHVLNLDAWPAPEFPLAGVISVTGDQTDFIESSELAKRLPDLSAKRIAALLQQVGVEPTRRRCRGELRRGYFGIQLREPA